MSKVRRERRGGRRGVDPWTAQDAPGADLTAERMVLGWEPPPSGSQPSLATRDRSAARSAAYGERQGAAGTSRMDAARDSFRSLGRQVRQLGLGFGADPIPGPMQTRPVETTPGFQQHPQQHSHGMSPQRMQGGSPTANPLAVEYWRRAALDRETSELRQASPTAEMMAYAQTMRPDLGTGRIRGLRGEQSRRRDMPLSLDRMFARESGGAVVPSAGREPAAAGDHRAFGGFTRPYMGASGAAERDGVAPWDGNTFAAASPAQGRRDITPQQQERLDARMAQQETTGRRILRRRLSRMKAHERADFVDYFNANRMRAGLVPIDPASVGIRQPRGGGGITYEGQEGRPATLNPLDHDINEFVRQADIGDVGRILEIAEQTGDQTTMNALAEIDEAIQRMGEAGYSGAEQQEAVEQLRDERARVAWRFAQTAGYMNTINAGGATGSGDLLRTHGTNSPFMLPNGSMMMFKRNGDPMLIAGPEKQQEVEERISPVMQGIMGDFGVVAGQVTEITPELRSKYSLPRHWTHIEFDRDGRMRGHEEKPDPVAPSAPEVVEIDGLLWSKEGDSWKPIDRHLQRIFQEGNRQDAIRRLQEEAVSSVMRDYNSLARSTAEFHEYAVNLGVRGADVAANTPPTAEEREAVLNSMIRTRANVSEQVGLADGLLANIPSNTPSEQVVPALAHRRSVQEVDGNMVPMTSIPFGGADYMVPDITMEMLMSREWGPNTVGVVDGEHIGILRDLKAEFQ